MAPSIDSFIVQKLNDMRVNGVMCDLELVAEDGACVLVHSAVWVAAFEDPSCLREMGKEYTLSSNQLDIFGVSGSVLATVVEFIYGNKVKPTDELKAALDKFGMKDWITYLKLPVSKYPKETCKEEKCAGTNVKPSSHSTDADRSRDGSTAAILPVSIKVEKDADIVENDYTQELRGKKRKSLAIDEPEQRFSECKIKDIDVDLSRVKSEPISPGSSQCSSVSFTFTNSRSTSSTGDSVQQEMENMSDKTSTGKTIPKEEPSNDETPSPTNQILYAAPSTFENSGNSSKELPKESSETASQVCPVVLDVRSLADNPGNMGNIVPWKVTRGARSSKKTSKAPTSTPRKLQALLPKQTEVKNQSCEKPSPTKDDNSCNAGNTSTTLNGNAIFSDAVFSDAIIKQDHFYGKAGDKTSNGRPLGPEPVKLFLNNSNLNSLQLGAPWNIVGNTNAANSSNIQTSTKSTAMYFPSGTPNVLTTATTSLCTSTRAPVAATSMNPGQNTVSNNTQVVRSSYNSIALPLGSFPNMPTLGANQTPNVLGSAGSSFVKPIAIGSPVVGPMSLTNSLNTGPIIGNFGCQVLQNAGTVAVSQAIPVGLNTASTASTNNTTLQNNAGALQLVNNQLGNLVFVNSDGNQHILPPFSFVGSPQSGSVSSANVLQNSIPFATTPTRLDGVQNVIGSPQSSTGNLSGTTVQLNKGAATVTPQPTCTTKPRHIVPFRFPSTTTSLTSPQLTYTIKPGSIMSSSSTTASSTCTSPQLTNNTKHGRVVPSSSTVASSTSHKFSNSDGKPLETGLNCEEKSISIGKTLEMQGSSLVTESQVCMDNARKNPKDTRQETATLKANPTDSDSPFVIDLDNEDDDDVNPLEIPIAQNTIRNMMMSEIPRVKNPLRNLTTALEFQTIDPITKSALYAPVLTKKKLGTRQNKVAGRKKVVMLGRNCYSRIPTKKNKVSDPQQPTAATGTGRRRGRPPKNQHEGVMYSVVPKKSYSKIKPEPPKRSNAVVDSEPVLVKFRPIAPKARPAPRPIAPKAQPSVLATVEMTPLQ